MASTSLRFMIRASLHSRRPTILPSKAVPTAAAAMRSPLPTSTSKMASISSVRRFSSYSLLPLQTAVAAARLTSRLSLASQSSRALSQGIISCRAHPGP